MPLKAVDEAGKNGWIDQPEAEESSPARTPDERTIRLGKPSSVRKAVRIEKLRIDVFESRTTVHRQLVRHESTLREGSWW